MNEEPPVPQPIPEIPRGPLWTSLAVPGAFTALSNSLIGVLGANFMIQALTLFVPIAVIGLIIVFGAHFISLTSIRYKGTSMLFLGFSYYLGQIIICLTIYIGSCALFFNPSSFH